MINKSTLEFIKSLSLADKKTLTGKTLKASEEVGELAKEILPYDNNSGTLHRFPTKNKILEESVDVILTALSIAYSLGYEDEAIDNMMLQKSKKWDGLQKNEKNFNSELIPFEIHITVNEPNGLSDGFKYYCEFNDIKAIFIENYNENGQYVDVMTSTKHIGTNKSVLAEVDRITKILEHGGWDIIRKKIETPIWHPIAKFHPYPVEGNYSQAPKDVYFECHLEFILEENNIKDFKQYIDKFFILRKNLHFSRNLLKKNIDDKSTIILTYRTNEYLYAFEDNLKQIIDLLDEEYPPSKIYKEFAIYDTNVLLDDKWMNK